MPNPKRMGLQLNELLNPGTVVDVYLTRERLRRQDMSRRGDEEALFGRT